MGYIKNTSLDSCMVLAMAPKITVSEMIHDAVTANMYLLQLRFFSEEKEKNKYYWKITVKEKGKI